MDDLLDAADLDGGRIEANAFWAFAARLAQGRGIADELHGAGLEAMRAVDQSPRSTFPLRQARAYHIALLTKLLADAGRLPGQGRLLPGDFLHGVVAHDLLGMLDGPGGMGGSKPQFLFSAREGLASLRRAAQTRLVEVVYWRMGRTGQSRATVWEGLMGTQPAERHEDGGSKDRSTIEDGDRASRRGDKSKIDRWQANAGGKDGALCRTAFEAGRANLAWERWSATNDMLAPVIDLANSKAKLNKSGRGAVSRA